MARIQQSIEVGVPVHVAYNQLTQFEDYPRFMQDVDLVEQIDDTHLHWAAHTPARSVEWNAEIVEQHPDRCIAWRNDGGPIQGGRVEVEQTGSDRTRVTLAMDCDPLQLAPVQDGNADTEVARRMEQDLARFKQYVETRGSETGSWRGEVDDARVTLRDRDAREETDGSTMGKTVGQAADERNDAAQSSSVEGGARQGTMSAGAGSEGFSGDEDPSAPVASAGAASPGDARQPSADAAATPQQGRSTQSDHALSRGDDAGQDGRFSVAEEVSFDMQSDDARRIGQLPEDPGMGAATAADALGKSLEPDESAVRREVKPAVDRAVPPSEE